MKQEYIFLRWCGGGITGYIDVLPRAIVEPRTNGRAIEHWVVRPDGRTYGMAKCRVVFRSTFVELDYRRFREFNERRGMDTGVYRIHFSSKLGSVTAESKIEWKKRNGRTFHPVEVRIVDDYRPTGPHILAQDIYEGSLKRGSREEYGRDPRARQLCLDRYGPICQICEFDFGTEYGHIADGLIHVHHVTPLAQRRGRHKVDPVKDLRPVCPNCHAVIHLCRTEFSVEEVKQLRSEVRRLRSTGRKESGLRTTQNA